VAKFIVWKASRRLLAKLYPLLRFRLAAAGRSAVAHHGLLTLTAPHRRRGRELGHHGPGSNASSAASEASPLASLPKALSAAASSLRSIYDASIVELRIRCTMQVWICACRYTASMASGKPRRHINTNDQDVNAGLHSSVR
jgi:hypothetical protein